MTPEQNFSGQTIFPHLVQLELKSSFYTTQSSRPGRGSGRLSQGPCSGRPGNAEHLLTSTRTGRRKGCPRLRPRRAGTKRAGARPDTRSTGLTSMLTLGRRDREIVPGTWEDHLSFNGCWVDLGAHVQRRGHCRSSSTSLFGFWLYPLQAFSSNAKFPSLQRGPGEQHSLHGTFRQGTASKAGVWGPLAGRTPQRLKEAGRL